MPDNILFLDNTDVSATGIEFRVTDLSPLFGGISLSHSEVPVLDRAGKTVGRPTQLSTAPRRVEGHIKAATPAALATAVDNLRALTGWGRRVEVRTMFASDRAFYAVSKGDTLDIPDKGLATRAEGSLLFDIPTPIAFELQHRVLVGEATERVSIPTWNWPCTPLVYVFGAATNPVVTFRAADGRVTATLDFSAAGGLTLGADDYVAVALHDHTVVRSLAGVLSSGQKYLVSTGELAIVDHNTGRSALGIHNTVETSVGSLYLLHRRVSPL